MKKYHVLGVMSGTSLDGIDIAEVELSCVTEKWNYSFGKTTTFAYPMQWKQKLQNAVLLDDDALSELNQAYTAHLAETILAFIQTNKLKTINAVCSHGHTVKHRPDLGFTLQIGNLPVLAKQLQLPVVCDFRVQDVDLGGQGAPLVPIGDRLLFSAYEYCLNLGGFANISSELNQQRIAYDVCAVNTVLNFYAEKLGFPYDNKGGVAKRAVVSSALLARLNVLDYYQKSAPKSLGIEWVTKHIFPILEESKCSPEVILATYTKHIAEQLAKEIPKGRVLVTGGGAYNEHLINLLKKETKASIETPSKQLLEYKEALIFALLGVLKLEGKVNVLQSVTGATSNHSSGKIFLP
ncbi:MAG: anhydro-N-acetylmuramic acid kinase [Mesonia hippocampi]|uniref:anhydro-N-acetylmuramic acid kinase n=1 Tax=Mesonia hippocampi TaxID=1628250 RepID=UPI003F994DF8